MSTENTAFNAWYHPEKDYERFVYVGCVHETTDAIVQRLAQVAENPPDYLIFGGDVTGSHELEKFKRLFYNHVYNRARGELRIGTDNEKVMTDDKLLAYVGTQPPAPNHSLMSGYDELMQYQWSLEGISKRERLSRLNKLTIEDIANGIRHIAKNFTYFGPWVRTLSKPVREGVVRTLRADAEKLLAAIKPIQDSGTTVIMVGGNWDNAEITREAMVGEGIDVFDTIPFFRNAGIQFYDQEGSIETERTLHVFLPYWELVPGRHESAQAWADHNQVLQNRMWHYCRLRESGKTHIMVTHAEPNWRVHNTTSLAEPTGDRKTSIDTLTKLLAWFRPDEVIYPHQHNLLTDAQGQRLSPNTKYLLEIGDLLSDQRTIRLVTDSTQFNLGLKIIASYIPYQRLATLNVPKSGNPRPKLFGGTRDPAWVM